MAPTISHLLHFKFFFFFSFVANFKTKNNLDKANGVLKATWHLIESIV